MSVALAASNPDAEGPRRRHGLRGDRRAETAASTAASTAARQVRVRARATPNPETDAVLIVRTVFWTSCFHLS